MVSLRSNDVLQASNVDQAALAEAHVPPTAVELDPQTDADRARFLFANIGTVLILVGIFSFGFAVLTGVVEEKQSRVVEVVLSTVRPRDLLMGKVFGIGVLGLVQLAVFMGAALIAARLTGSFELPSTTPIGIVMLVVWFILGYTLYSTALGFLGALASRMEEASNASTPVTMIAMISYFVAILVGAQRPDRDRRADRDLPAAVGADGRPAAGGARRHRAVGGRRLDASSPSPRSGPCSRSGRASTRVPSSRWAAGSSCATPGGRPGSRAAVVAGGRRRPSGVAAAPRRPAPAQAGSSGSNRPGPPPACQNRTRWPSSAPERTRPSSPASAFAV